VETKLREGTSKLSTGQKALKKHTELGNKEFEVSFGNRDFKLEKKKKIIVDEYEIKYKYHR